EIDLEHRKTIEDKDNQLMQLGESNKALDTELKRFANEVNTLQSINLEHQKTIQEKDIQIMKLSDSNRTMEMELRNLRATIVAIQNSIAWRTLTPIKVRYDAIFHRSDNNKTKPTYYRAKSRAAALIQATTGEQIVKNIVP